MLSTILDAINCTHPATSTLNHYLSTDLLSVFLLLVRALNTTTVVHLEFWTKMMVRWLFIVYIIVQM